MAKTIYVRKGPYEREGKFGKQYLVLSSENLYYEQNKPFPEGVEEGIELEVEATPSKNPKYLKLKSCRIKPKPYTHPSSVSQKEQGRAGLQSITPTPQAPLPKLTPHQQLEFMEKADKAMSLKFGPDWDIMVLAPVYAELIHQHYGDYVAEQQRARWGK